MSENTVKETPMPPQDDVHQELSSLLSRVAVLEESNRATGIGLTDISKKLDIVLTEVTNWKVIHRDQQQADESIKGIAATLEKFMNEDYKPFKEDTQGKINVGKGLWIAGSALWVVIISMAMWYLNLKVSVVEEVPVQVEVLKTQVQTLSTQLEELKRQKVDTPKN